MLKTLDLIVSPDVRMILSKVAKCTSFATIAGGYLRDQYYRVPHKDLDIFTYDDLDIDKLKSLFSEWIVDDGQDGEYDLGAFETVNMTRDNSVPIQVMASDHCSVSEVLDRFDFGFCQIAYDGSNVLVTDAFWKDATDNTATFVQEVPSTKCGHDQRRTRRHNAHADRLKIKYPNVTWIWP